MTNANKYSKSLWTILPLPVFPDPAKEQSIISAHLPDFAGQRQKPRTVSL